jgi:hypothetical protein
VTPASRAAALALVLLLTACSEQEPPAAAGSDLGLEHVHGLGVDPADGVLYAATHFGVFRLPEGEPAVRVADRYQDTMGFTVAGPRTFLASGHPDFRKDPDLPPRLGLIRSEDAAQTWQPVSVTGQADLHALRSTGWAVYALDSATGRLLFSADEGASWEVRSTTPGLDLAISPDDDATLVVATGSGPQRSTDGGRSLTPLDGPALVALAWDDGPALFGVDVAGRVHVSPDAGTTWEPRGSLGAAPEALTAVDQTLYAAAQDRGVLQSDDAGRTWSVRYAAP